MIQAAKTPAKLWKLDETKLLPGDVLLERGSGWVSRGIRMFDFGRFSHALIWCGPVDFFEAVDGGTRAISFARFFIEKPKAWSLMRLVGDPGGAARAAYEARNLAHVPYSTAGAIKTKSPFSRIDSTGQFCSQLVALCYEKAGIELVAGKKSHKVTPAGLQKKSRLTQVELPLIEITDAADREWAVPFLDRDKAYEDSFPEKDRVVSGAVMIEVATLLPQLKTPETVAYTHPPRNIVEVLTMLQLVPESVMGPVADALLAAMKKHAYLSMIDDALPQVKAHNDARIAWLHDTALPAEARAKIEAEFLTLTKAWADARDRFLDNFDIHDQTNALRPHPLWLELATMYRRNADAFNDLIEQVRSEPLTRVP